MDIVDREYLSWNEIEDMCRELAIMVNKPKDKYKPDVLLGLSRGGLVPLRIMSDMLNINDMFVLRVKSYDTIKKVSKPVIDDHGCRFDLDGKRVLVIDDVADSGESLKVTKEYLETKYNLKDLRFLTLHYKPNSEFKPDYYLKTTNKWIVYPWEKKEMEREKKRKRNSIYI